MWSLPKCLLALLCPSCHRSVHIRQFESHWMNFHDIWYWVGCRNVSPSSNLIKVDNRTDTSRSTLSAHILSIACYIYVRVENVSNTVDKNETPMFCATCFFHDSYGCLGKYTKQSKCVGLMLFKHFVNT